MIGFVPFFIAEFQVDTVIKYPMINGKNNSIQAVSHFKSTEKPSTSVSFLGGFIQIFTNVDIR